MKAVFYNEHGDAGVLQLGDLPIPEPAADEVLVQVAATSVNPIDRRLRAGELTEYITRTFPVVPGWDLAGRIVKVGADVRDWQVGDDILGLAFTWSIQHGTYAEYAPVKAESIAKKPSGLSFSEGAALPLVTLTAWQSLSEFADLKPGQTVLIQAGAGGVGSVAIPIAKHLGAKVYTTASAANGDYVRSLGADEVIDYRETDYVQYIKDREPQGLDAVLESILSDATIEAAIHLVKDHGTVAYLNNEPPAMPEIEAKNIKTEFIHHRPDGQSLGQLLPLFEQGVLKVPRIQKMALEQAEQAHLLSESTRTQGKIVLRIQDI